MSASLRSALILLAAMHVPAAGEAPGAPRVVTIGYAFDGGLVNLAVGDELDVRLGSTPGTGYSWSVAINDAAILEPIGKPVDEKSQDPRPGAPGSRLFRFRAVKAGSSSLGLVYERPWEKNAPPARLFAVAAAVGESLSGKPVALVESDGGARYFLLQGETLRVKLPANPSTGLAWAVTRNAPSILKPAGEPRLEMPEKPAPGQGGFQVFEFQVAGMGAAALELSYRNVLEKDRPPARTWTIFVSSAAVRAEKPAK